MPKTYNITPDVIKNAFNDSRNGEALLGSKVNPDYIKNHPVTQEAIQANAGGTDTDMPTHTNIFGNAVPEGSEIMYSTPANQGPGDSERAQAPYVAAFRGIGNALISAFDGQNNDNSVEEARNAQIEAGRKFYDETLGPALRSTDIYNNWKFNYGGEDNLVQAQKLSRFFHQPADVFLNDREEFVKGSQMMAWFETDSRVAPGVDRSDPVEFGNYLNEHYPVLKNATPTEFKIALLNAADVKAVQGLGANLILAKDLWAIGAERGDIANQAFYGSNGKYKSDYLPEEAIKRYQALGRQYEELRKKIPQFWESPLSNVLVRTGEQVGGMGQDFFTGGIIGGVGAVGAYTVTNGNVAAAKKVGALGFKYGSMVGMFTRQVGEKYIEYSAYKDKDGGPLYTPNEARVRAAIETGIETGIEFWNYDEIMKALGGSGRAAIQDIVARNKGNAEAIKGGLSGYLAQSAKTWAPRMKEEVQEEALQSLTSDLMHNYMVGVERPDNQEETIPVTQMLQNAKDAMAEAVPSVAGMVIGGDALSNINAVRKLARIAQIEGEAEQERVDNFFTVQTLKDLRENQKESRLFKKDPELYKKTVKVTMQEAGMPNVYVDTEMLLQEENGQEVFNQLAKESGYSQEEAQKVVESKGDLEVPVEVYNQVTAPGAMDDKAAEKVFNMTTSAPDLNSPARVRSTLERMKANVEALAAQDEKEQQEIIPSIVKANFQDEEEQRIATDILSSNPGNPQEGLRQAIRNAENELDSILRPVWEEEEKESKEGLSEYTARRDRNSILQETVLTKDHALRRHSFWTNYFGQVTPTVSAKTQYAYDILTGQVTGSQKSIGAALDLAMQNGDAEAAESIRSEMAANKEKLDGLMNTVATLNAMKDRFQKIDGVETTITRGMKPETYNVYRATTENLSQSSNAKVRKAARYDGVLFARMCERLADEWTKQGKKTTAKDIAAIVELRPGEPQEKAIRASSLAQAMYDVTKSGITTVSGLVDLINRRKANGEKENKIKLTTDSGVTFGEERVVHVQAEHGLTKEDLDDIQDNINELHNPSLSGWKKGEYIGQYGGKAVLARVDGRRYTYVTVLEFAKNGNVWFNTAYTFKNKEIADKKIKEERSAVLSLKSAVSDGTRSSFTVSSIKEALGIVKKNFYNQQGGAIRGQTTKTGDIISLFEAADQSTFMHETAHWYLINMQSLALNDNASEQFKKDFMTIQNWFGNKHANDDISDLMHEKFAKGFEAYLREGKAPAPQLRSIFARFKNWLTNIYRDLKQLDFGKAGYKMTDEVRQVMDRMIATQDEIDLAMKDQMVDDFRRGNGTRILGQDNVKTWNKLVDRIREDAEAKVMKKVMEDLTIKDIEKKVEAERGRLIEELDNDTLWYAYQISQELNGDLSHLADMGYTPEEYKAEVEKRGGSPEAELETRLKAFREELEQNPVDREQLEKAAAAAIRGSEYQEMLHALEYRALADYARRFVAEENEKEWKEAVKQERAKGKEEADAMAEAERQRQIGEKLTMQEEARNKIVNDTKAKMEGMRQGIRIVRDEILGTVHERRDFARSMLSKLPMNQAMNVALWAKKLGQKQQEVYKLMSQGKWDEAANVKRDQLLYAAMVTEAGKIQKQIQKETDQIQRNIRSLQKGNPRMPARERYWYQHLAYVLGLTRSDGVMPTEPGTLRQVFGELIGQPKDMEGDTYAVPDWLERLGMQEGRFGMEKLSPDNWQIVRDYMGALYKMSRERDNLFSIKDEQNNTMRVSETAKALAENLLEHNGTETTEYQIDNNETLDKMGRKFHKAKEFMGDFAKSLFSPLTIIQRMDGYEGPTGQNRTGLAMHTLYDPVMRATNKEIDMRANFYTRLQDIFKVYNGKELDDMRNKRVYRFGERILTKEEIMCLALNMGTESGYSRILDNENIGGDMQFQTLAQRENAVEAALNDVLRELDKRDWETITGVWDLMGAHFDEASGVKERTTGIPLGKVATRAFDVKGRNGEVYHLQGGYYPIAYDAEQSVQVNEIEQQDRLNSMSPGALRKAQGLGFTKSRRDRVTGRPLLLSFDTIARKGGEQMHYIAFREAALDINRLINNEDFKNSMIASFGVSLYQDLQQWGLDIWQAPKGTNAFADKVIRAMRTRTTTAVLAYRVSTMLLNAANAGLMMMYTGPGQFFDAFQKFYSDFDKNSQFVYSQSPFMAQRAERVDTNVREALEAKQASITGLSAWDKLNKNGFKLIGMTDNMFALPLWYCEYMKTYNLELQKNTDHEMAQQRAIAAGDRAVIRVIGSGELKDLSKFQKGGEGSKLLTMFYTFQNALYNMAVNKIYASKQIYRETGSFTQAMLPIAHYFLFGVMLNAAIEMGTREALKSIGGGDDKKKKDLGYYFKTYAQTSLDNQTATVPILRDMWRPISQAVFDPDNMWNFQSNRGKFTSAFDLAARFVDAGTSIAGFAQDKKTGQDVMWNTGKAVSALLGAPDMFFDGVSNAVDFMTRNASDRDIAQFVGAVMLDRRLKKAKKGKTLTPYQEAVKGLKRKRREESNSKKKK